jgi:hypothetical protein
MQYPFAVLFPEVKAFMTCIMENTNKDYNNNSYTLLQWTSNFLDQ